MLRVQNIQTENALFSNAYRLALALLPSLLVTACGGNVSDVPNSEKVQTPVAESTQVDLGPMEYDDSGTMPCSVGKPSFDEACGWRVIRDSSEGVELWISNIASEEKPAYRVLLFSDGAFTAKDGTPLKVSQEGDTWIVSAEDGGYFQIVDEVITGN